MIFQVLLIGTVILGGGLGALLSCRPGKWRRALPVWPVLSALAGGLFVLGLCLWTRSFDLTAVWNRFFPDRLSKLAGCGALFLLCCGLGLLTGFLRAGGAGAYFRQIQGSALHRWVGLGLLAAVPVLVLGCTVLAGDPAPTPVRLNEVCCANFSLRADADSGAYSDYVELINTGEEAVDLSGYYLSDEAKKRNRFRLPALTLEPGECVVLWADGTGKTGTPGGEELHLSFSLKPGDTVWFTSPHGVLLDQVTVPARYKNVSLSRIDGAWALAKGTPGTSNEDAALYAVPTLEPPTLSLASGFYPEPQTLTLTAAPGCEIRYTLDGSVPTAESPLYEGPLTLTDVSDQPNRVVSQKNTTTDRSGAITEPVDKGTVLRAAAFDGTGALSETVTAVYFIGDFSDYENRLVLSIVAAPVDLFGNYGICVTGLDYDNWLASGSQGIAPWPMFNRHGRALERDAVIQLWDAEGELMLESLCGLRVQGDSSRTRPLKRFRLTARDFYGGSDLFSARIFRSGLSHSFTTRQDSKDVIVQSLLSERELGGLEAHRASVFLNGEFYYACFLRERYDWQYFQTHYGVDPEDLILISDDKLDEGTEADYADYRALMDHIAASDCSDPAVYAELCERIDVESFAAFIAGNLYLNNTDWSVYKDCRLWRTRSTGGEGLRDGRWRWLIYDMDAVYWTLSAFGDAPRASYDLFTYSAPYTEEPFLEMPVFRELLRSPDFRDVFARVWLELMNVDCSYDRGMALIRRNGFSTSFFSEFLQERPAYALDILIEHIVPEGRACGLTLKLSDAPGGTVKVGVMAPTFSEGTWTGAWVTGVSLNLTAEPTEGWRFVAWSDGSAEPARTLTPAGDVELTAIFEPTNP